MAKKRSKRSKKSSCPKSEVRDLMKSLNLHPSYCHGIVTPRGSKIPNNRLASFNDLMCVIADKKPIALIDLSRDTLAELEPYTRQIINEIIRISHLCGVYTIKHETGSGSYLAFKKKGVMKAMMYGFLYSEMGKRYLNYPRGDINHYLAGKLLGYSDANIRAFYQSIGLEHDFHLDKQATTKIIKAIKRTPAFDQYYHMTLQHVRPLPYV